MSTLVDVEKMAEMRVKEKKTLQQIGNQFDLSRERVRQLLPKDVNEAGKKSRQKQPKQRKEVQHGTRTMYNYGCRCTDCRKNNAVVALERRKVVAAKLASGQININHGYSGYINYSCRCAVCNNAHNKATLEQTRIRKQKVRLLADLTTVPEML